MISLYKKRCETFQRFDRYIKLNWIQCVKAYGQFLWNIQWKPKHSLYWFNVLSFRACKAVYRCYGEAQKDFQVAKKECEQRRLNVSHNSMCLECDSFAVMWTPLGRWMCEHVQSLSTRQLLFDPKIVPAMKINLYSNIFQSSSL